jgi:hypothetical protein
MEQNFLFLTWHKSRCEIAEVVMLSQCAPADDTPAPFKPSAESVVPAQLFSSPAPGTKGMRRWRKCANGR